VFEGDSEGDILRLLM